MFTGIIEGLGTVTGIAPQGKGSRIELSSDFDLQDVRIGDSVAVNGVCLTAVTIQGNIFSIDASPETLSLSSMGQMKVGDRVNLERALRLGDRLDGHLVTGHVDGTGKVSGKRAVGNAIVFSFSVPTGMTRYIVKKGSIAVDGISLTVNTCGIKSFEVSIIPHTADVTTLTFRKVGDTVNVETDIVGKYIEQFTNKALGKDGNSRVDASLLTKTGFM